MIELGAKMGLKKLGNLSVGLKLIIGVVVMIFIAMSVVSTANILQAQREKRADFDNRIVMVSDLLS